MGNSSSLFLTKEEISLIQNDTGFTSNQIERLYSRFTSLDKSDSGCLTKEDFLRIPELAINPLGSRIVDGFFEQNGKSSVNFPEFMRVLACFRPLHATENDSSINSRQKKLKFVFNLYDLNNDGFISKQELISALKTLVGVHISLERLDILATNIMLSADTDKDQKISFTEFCEAVKHVNVEHKLAIRFLD